FPESGQADLLQQSLSERCDEIIKRFRLRRNKYFHIGPTVEVDLDGSKLHLKPSYQWLNGRDIFYQKVSIDQSRIESTQKDVTSATWVLERLRESFRGAETRALIKISDNEDGVDSNWHSSEYL